MRLSTFSSGLLIAVAAASSASASTVYVNTLGASTGWYSDDTRNGEATTDQYGSIARGQVLNGLNSSYQGYFSYPGAPAASAADDARIARQIYFSNPYAGSTDDSGVMSLSGTIGGSDANFGKSSVRYYNGGVIASGSALSNISSTFRWYMDAQPTSRTVAFNMLVMGSNNLVYSLAWLGNGAQMNSWNEFSLNANTDGWRIYGNGAPGSSGASFSMTSLLADATYGSLLSNGSVIGVGFNIGSYQRNCIVGIDWLETSLLNNGNRIDFGTVPTPGALALLGLAGLAGRRRR